MRYRTRYFVSFAAICSMLYFVYLFTAQKYVYTQQREGAALPVDPETLQKSRLESDNHPQENLDKVGSDNGDDVGAENNPNELGFKNNPNDVGIENNPNDLEAEDNLNDEKIENNSNEKEAENNQNDVFFQNNPKGVVADRMDGLDTEVKDERLKVKGALEEDDPELQGIPWDKFDADAYVDKTRLKPGEDKYEKNKFNQEASDNLTMDRDIPDTRDQQCSQKTWRTDLPATSVIIIFYNEARSTLLRTVISVFLRSPAHLIKEVILVDDYSEDPRTGKELTAIAKVKLIRNQQREGLIRSRVTGADAAKAKILTFLDSHCECNQNWLEPLLERVAEDRSRVLSPVIDYISLENFGYRGSPFTAKGGFNWKLDFTWDFMTPRDMEARNDGTSPVRTPTIAGGLFSIDKSWFDELGKYDLGMDVWGGENVEISLRVWLCHGSLEIVPCSRVGHVFRKQFPYKFPGGNFDTITKNKRRTAEVWLDEYKKYFFETVPIAKQVEFGNVTERLELKTRLKCKPFKWFMENVYPELRIPDRKGRFKQGDLCIDSLGKIADGIVDLYQCHDNGGNQAFTLSKTGHIRQDGRCITLSARSPGSPVKLRKCWGSDPNQKWKRVKQPPMLKHKSSNLCLDASAMADIGLSVKECDPHSAYQKWEYILYEEHE